VFPEHGQQTQTLLRSADLAMYSVKRAGTGDYRFAERPDVDPANGPEGV
jgi:GGDEF domain-containing protein